MISRWKYFINLFLIALVYEAHRERKRIMPNTSSVFLHSLHARRTRFAAQRMGFPCHRAAFFPMRNNAAFSRERGSASGVSPRRSLSPSAMRNDVPRMNRQTRARNIQNAHAIVRLRPESPLFRGGFFFCERSIQTSTDSVSLASRFRNRCLSYY